MNNIARVVYIKYSLDTACIIFSILYVFIPDPNSQGPDDGPIRTETRSPTTNKGL